MGKFEMKMMKDNDEMKCNSRNDKTMVRTNRRVLN